MEKKTGQNKELKDYKSPKRILFRFFEKSRNKWKEKCKEAKYQNKLLQNKNRYLKKDKEVFKNRVKELESELRQMKHNEKQMAEKIEQLKKNIYR